MTPEEIRAKALECAAILWASGRAQNGDLGDVFDTAQAMEEYITGPDRAVNRLAPLPSAEVPREHLDHDGDLWGPLCARCAHSREIHKFGGCHFPEMNASGVMTYCECEGHTDVRPAAPTLVQAVLCERCEKPWTDTHGLPGDPCSIDVTPEPSPEGCTCYKHTHGYLPSSDLCTYFRCYCRWAGGRTE